MAEVVVVVAKFAEVVVAAEAAAVAAEFAKVEVVALEAHQGLQEDIQEEALAEEDPGVEVVSAVGAVEE